MRTRFIITVIIALLLPALLLAQSPSPPLNDKPALKRDRTQRVLNPKIVQMEDERLFTPELIDILNHSHGGIVRRAVIALGRIGSPSAISSLVSVLNTGRSPELRALAAFSLGEIESHYAASDLLARLNPAKESSAIVRARAIEALGKIASNRAAATELGNYGVSGISDAIARLLPSADQPPSEDAKLIGSMALTALLRLRQPSTIGAIAAQLKSPAPELKWQAANALARIREGIAAAVPALLPLVDDRDALVRAHAARALGVAKDARAVEPLIKLLHDSDQRVVVNAVNALGTIADARAVDSLVAVGNRELDGYKSFDRAKQGVPPQQNLLLLIATSLASIKDARALPFLKAERAAMGGPGSQPEVEIAIAKFGEAAFFDSPEGTTRARDDWKAMAAYAQGLGQLATDRARATLLDMLKPATAARPDARAVPDILNAMAATKIAGLRDILLEYLKAEDVIVRTTAATLLGDLGDGTEIVTKALEDAYKAARADKMNDARIAILEASDKLKHPLSLQVLSGPLRDEDYVVRQRAIELLRQSSKDESSMRLQPDKVETGHDRAYWRRVAQLMTAPKNPVAVLHTKKGEIRIELLAADAPMTVDNFIQLSRNGFYNGLTFMRVVPNFVIQGGDPRNDTNGGPGYQIRCEINLRQYAPGAVGMALSGKDTGGSQFFITHSPQPHLDGGYTVFGQVVAGMDVVNRIARDDRIERVEIIQD